MKTSTETFVIISPPESVNYSSLAIKEKIKKILRYSFESEFSKAHISLIKYEDSHRDNMLYHIGDIVSYYKPFNIYIKGFDVLQHGSNRTICFDIVNKVSVQEIFYSLTGKNIRPHITIAKNLSKEDFDKVWPSIKNISYSHHFFCNHLTVLKGNPGSWHYYMDLGFSS